MGKSDPERQLNIYLSPEEVKAFKQIATMTGLEPKDIAHAFVRSLIREYSASGGLHFPPATIPFVVEQIRAQIRAELQPPEAKGGVRLTKKDRPGEQKTG